MASAETAFNTNIPLQTDIEQAMIGTELEDVQAEFLSLPTLPVATEAVADSPNLAGMAENDTVIQPRKSAESHKVVAGLTAAALAITGSLSVSVAFGSTPDKKPGSITRIYEGASLKIAQAKVSRMQKRAKASLAVGGHDRGTDGHGDVLTQEPISINGKDRIRYTLTLNHFKKIVGGEALVKTFDGRAYFATMHRSSSKKDTYTYTSQSGGTPPSIGMDLYLR